MILMKQAFMQQEKPNRPNNRPGYLQWKWFLGFILLFSTSSLTVIGEAYVSLILSSSTEATALISGVLLSILWLGEKFYPQYDIPALTLITVGCLSVLCIATA